MSFLRGPRGSVWRRVRAAVAPSVTYVLITITLLVFLAQLLPGSPVTEVLLYRPLYTLPWTGFPFEPWRLLTVALVHSTGFLFHILFNMVALWMFGQQVESALGGWRFLVLYVLSALGGSIAVLYWALLVSGELGQAVVGASGAVFGLLGAFFVVARKFGANTAGIAILIALNLGIGFLFRTISWQAHVGGLLAGMLVAFVIVQTRRRAQQPAQYLLLGAVAAGLVIAALLPAVLGRAA